MRRAGRKEAVITELSVVPPPLPAPAAPPGVSDYAAAEQAIAAVGRRGIDSLPAVGAALGERCPRLAAILAGSEVRVGTETWRRQDAAAVEQQRRLMREVNIGNACIISAGLLSGLVLAGPSLPVTWPSLAPVALGVLILLLGAVGATLAYITRDQARLGRWLARRSEAEMARLGVFRAIAAQAAVADPAVALYGLALISSALLDEQRAWLGARIAEHRRSSERTSLFGGLASGLAFVGGSGAVIAGFVPNSAWIAFAGILGASLAAFAINREALRRDRANGERYEKAEVTLDGLAAQRDAIVARIAGGEPAALVAFTTAVTDQLAVEHKQWLDGATQTEMALAKLDEALKRIGDRPKS